MSLDSLERRRLLAAAMPASLADHVDSSLWQSLQLDVNARTPAASQRGPKGVRFNTQGAAQAYVRVDAGSLSSVQSAIAKLGVNVDDVDTRAGVIQTYLSPAQLDAIANLPGVSHVGVPDYAISNVVTSAGDSVLKADQVRSKFAAMGIDGTGIKIGVISDGANHVANVGAELPTVTIDPARPGSGDEGTAMLEIVHDLAPGAALLLRPVNQRRHGQQHQLPEGPGLQRHPRRPRLPGRGVLHRLVRRHRGAKRR
ncbi:MAG: hypothetical protein QM770_02160 [Tepidisphaeraceae bacterium]